MEFLEKADNRKIIFNLCGVDEGADVFTNVAIHEPKSPHGNDKQSELTKESPNQKKKREMVIAHRQRKFQAVKTKMNYEDSNEESSQEQEDTTKEAIDEELEESKPSSPKITKFRQDLNL